MSVLDQHHPDESSYCSFTFPLGLNKRKTLNGNEKKREEQMDSLLAHALSSLSFDERQKQQEVLHGVATEIPENDGMLSEAFKTLDYHLRKFKTGSAYETAESLDFAYVSNQAFRLMFLRGNRFDPKDAADQMIRFFEAKLNLFGKDKLVQDITMNDLDEDDRAFLRSGSLQLIGKDRAGRTIWVYLPGLRAFKTLENELRSRYYLTMELLKSAQTQKRGIVVVTYAIGQYKDSMNGLGYVDLVRLALAMPVHHAALHNCVEDQKEYILGSAALRIIPSKHRSRIRMWLGSHMEVQYTLSQYGITPRLLPLYSMTNEVRLDRHLRWYNECLERDTGGTVHTTHDTVVTPIDDTDSCFNNLLYRKEQLSESTNGHPIDAYENLTNVIDHDPSVIRRPGPIDVVLGRNNKGLGNQLMMRLVKELAGDYDSAGRGEKSTIADSIVQKIQEQGGRFLQQKGGLWEEVANDFARSKISKCFRNARRNKKKHANDMNLTLPIGDFDFW